MADQVKQKVIAANRLLAEAMKGDSELRELAGELLEVQLRLLQHAYLAGSGAGNNDNAGADELALTKDKSTGETHEAHFIAMLLAIKEMRNNIALRYTSADYDYKWKRYYNTMAVLNGSMWSEAKRRMSNERLKDFATVIDSMDYVASSADAASADGATSSGNTISASNITSAASHD